MLNKLQINEFPQSLKWLRVRSATGVSTSACAFRLWGLKPTSTMDPLGSFHTGVMWPELLRVLLTYCLNTGWTRLFQLCTCLWMYWNTNVTAA